jgi:serine/threonine protein kinase
MEFIDGYDLSRLQDVCLEKKLRIPIDVIAFVGREVCSGLSFAHSRRDRSGRALDLIHRDISPQNILLSFGGAVKIIDFGIAKVSTRMQQTHAGVIKGKFYYMSPEQAGAHQVDQRSDLFSLGICLWESLCSRSLFRREGGPNNPLAILHEIRSMPIPKACEFRRDCPKELEGIVARALSRDLDYRFKDATEMGQALNAFLTKSAPDFEKSRLSQFMIQSFEKEETSKELSPPPQVVQTNMSRNEFLPSEASMIFSVDPQDAETGIFEISFKKDSGETQILDGSEIMAAMLRIGSGSDAEQAPAESKEELAMSDTAFSKSEAQASRRREGLARKVRQRKSRPTADDSDPHSQTHMLPSGEIHAARLAYDRNAKEEQRPTDKKSHEPLRTQQARLSLTHYSLFRWLVLAILVLCILSVTLVILINSRADERERLILERDMPTQSHTNASSRY